MSTSTTAAEVSALRNLSRFPSTLDRQVVLGAACWALLLLFFIGQVVAQAAMKTPYSLIANNISDLGATRCGPLTVATYHTVACSPLHGVMNVTFMVAGLLSLLGAIGARRAWPRRRLTTWGLALLVLSGVGEIVAGFSPEDVNPGVHIFAAIMGIPGASIGTLLLGVAVWRVWRLLGVLSLLVGSTGLIGFLLTSNASFTGAAERLAVYPNVLWMIVLGTYLLWLAWHSDRQDPRNLRA